MSLRCCCNKRYFILAFSVVTALVLSVGATGQEHSDLRSMADLISRQHIAHPPVETIPKDSLAALKEWLQTLDPNSEYLSAADFTPASDPGGFVRPGLGGLITRMPGGDLMLAPFLGGPVYQAGIRNPAEVLAVEEYIAADLSLDEIAALAARRERLSLRVRDLISDRIFVVKVPIAPFQIPPLEVIDNGGRGILRLHLFIKDATLPALRQALERSVKREAPIVIDLRYASGGNLFESLDSVSLVLAGRVPIAATMDGGGKRVEFKARSDMRIARRPVYLLIGPNTASAAEVFARALHYYGYAVLVGQQSFGKCTSQQIFQLPAGDALKLTVNRILDPTGRFCDGHGVEPDIPYTGNIHDTAKLLQLIDAHNYSHRLICAAPTQTGMPALEQTRNALASIESEPERRIISLLTPKRQQQLCLAPARDTALARKILKDNADRENVTLVLQSLYQIPEQPPMPEPQFSFRETMPATITQTDTQPISITADDLPIVKLTPYTPSENSPAENSETSGAILKNELAVRIGPFPSASGVQLAKAELETQYHVLLERQALYVAYYIGNSNADGSISKSVYTPHFIEISGFADAEAAQAFCRSIYLQNAPQYPCLIIDQ